MPIRSRALQTWPSVPNLKQGLTVLLAIFAFETTFGMIGVVDVVTVLMDGAGYSRIRTDVRHGNMLPLHRPHNSLNIR